MPCGRSQKRRKLPANRWVTRRYKTDNGTRERFYVLKDSNTGRVKKRKLHPYVGHKHTDIYRRIADEEMRNRGDITTNDAQPEPVADGDEAENFAVGVSEAGAGALSHAPVVGGAVKAIPKKTLVESAKSSPIGSIGRKDLTLGQKATRFGAATATMGLSNLYYAKKDKEAKELKE